MKVCTHVNEIRREGATVRILTDGVELRVLLLTDDIVRIRAGFDGDFAEESYCRTRVEMTGGKRTTLAFHQEGSYPTAVETMELDVIHRENAPYWVTLDGTELPHFLHRRKFEEAERGWYYSQTLKSVQIKYPNPKGDHTVVISFEQFDMLGM